MVIWLWWWGAFSYCPSKPVQSTTVQIHTSGRRCGPRWTPEDTIGQGLSVLTRYQDHFMLPLDSRLWSLCRSIPPTFSLYCKTPRHRKNGNVLNQTKGWFKSGQKMTISDRWMFALVSMMIYMSVCSVKCALYIFVYIYAYIYVYVYICIYI